MRPRISISGYVRQVRRFVGYHFVLAYLLVTQGGSGRLCVTLGNSWVTLNDSGWLWGRIYCFQQGRESTNRYVLRATQSHSESLKRYQESHRTVQSRPELLRGAPEQSGNGPMDRPMDRRTYPLTELLMACQEVHKKVILSLSLPFSLSQICLIFKNFVR